MDKWKALATMSLGDVKNSTQDDMAKLSAEVHKAMVSSGYGTNACKTVCSVSVGADGKPVVTCSLVCDF
ncbi:MAG: hypothetical protein Q8N06_13835 [Hydrogenophaga sp.]|nr:hypothetical protein [Hydrogenophaga sp.]